MSFILPEHLEKALADPARIEREIEMWDLDPQHYIPDNYQRLASYDFPVYAAGNIEIQDREGRASKLIFNRVQRRLWQWFLEDLASGKPVRWFVIKSRQMGLTTWVLALYYWLTSLRPNRNALIVAQDDDATQMMNSRCRSIHAAGDPLLKSPLVMDNRTLIHFGNTTPDRKRGHGAGLDSRLVFTTAGKGELGRSYTFHMVLCSEFAIWPELGVDIHEQLTALNQTVAELPGTIVILESTGKGENAAKEFWDDQDNGYRKIFISWVAYEKYRLPTDDIGELCPTEEAGGKQTKHGNEVEEAELIRQQLAIWYPEKNGDTGWIEAEIRARLNWRRDTIDRKCMGDKTAFRREYPTIARHAFSATAKNCFDHESLRLMREAVEQEGLQGKYFHYLHDREQRDPNRKFQIGSYGPLIIYKVPDPYETYVIGGDPGMGIPNSGDPSALVVLAVPELEEVASFNSIITPDRFGELAYYLGLLYNKALLAIENNERGGYAANLVLAKQLHYPRLYYRFDAYDKKAAGNPGWATGKVNKSVLVSELAQLIHDHEILVRTPELLNQLESYMLFKDGKMGAPPGQHDDLVSALMIACHLSNKVHLYPIHEDPAPKGSFAWFAKQHAAKRSPGMFGFNR